MSGLHQSTYIYNNVETKKKLVENTLSFLLAGAYLYIGGKHPSVTKYTSVGDCSVNCLFENILKYFFIFFMFDIIILNKKTLKTLI